MLHKVYTFGYQGKQLSFLHEVARELKAVVVDIRYAPFSRNINWNRANLQMVFGDHYTHINQLGNENYKGAGPIQIADMNAGVDKVKAILEQSAVILLCVCSNVNTCHRKVVADALAERLGAEVAHLGQKPKDEPNQSTWL